MEEERFLGTPQPVDPGSHQRRPWTSPRVITPLEDVGSSEKTVHFATPTENHYPDTRGVS
jgi:hypothetical protein